MANTNLVEWDIITEADFNEMQFDSGVIVKNFDPTTFEMPDEGDLEVVTTGDISLNYGLTLANLGDDVNNIFFQYLELEVATGVSAATLGVTTLGFGAADIKRALGAADVDGNKITTRMYLKSTDFENIAWIGKKLGGGLVAVVIPKALCTSGLGITTTKAGKGKIACTFTGFRSISNKSKAEMEFYSVGTSGVKITAQPADVTTTVGTATTFSVTASGTSLTYQWEVLPVGGATYSNISGATSATLSLSTSDVISAASGNKYRCKISDSTGMIYSESATLTVSTGA